MNKKGIVSIFGMVMVWATYFLVSKWCVDLTGSPYVTGMVLRFVTLFVYIAIMLVCRQFKLLFKTKGVWYILIAVGTLGFLLDLFANIGFQHSQAGKGTVLLKVDILFANLATAIILRKRLSPLDWIFSIIMLFGIVLVLNIDFKNLSFNPYDLFFILSALVVTANAFLIKWIQTKFKVKSNVIAFYNNFVVLIMFSIASLITKDFQVLGQIDFQYSAYLFIILGGIGQAFIYVFYYKNLATFPVWLVKVFLLFIPVVTTTFSILFLNEKLTVITLVGMIIVLSGAFGIIMEQKRKNKNKFKEV